MFLVIVSTANVIKEEEKRAIAEISLFIDILNIIKNKNHKNKKVNTCVVIVSLVNDIV